MGLPIVLKRSILSILLQSWWLGSCNVIQIFKMVLLVTLGSLIGCQASSPLPYAASAEGPARFIRADYAIVGSKVQVTVDTSGFKVKSAFMARTNGKQIRSQAIQQPRDGADMNIGFGAGYMGSGRNTGATLGVGSAGNTVQTKTYIWFEHAGLGDPPWTLNLNVQGIEEVVTIELLAQELPVDP